MDTIYYRRLNSVGHLNGRKPAKEQKMTIIISPFWLGYILGAITMLVLIVALATWSTQKNKKK